MRTMVTVRVPVDRGNAAIQDGTIARLIQATMEKYHPDSAYFFTSEGHRTAQFVVDLADSSEMPPFGEPFFFELGAEVDFRPVMNAGELAKGLGNMASR